MLWCAGNATHNALFCVHSTTEFPKLDKTHIKAAHDYKLIKKNKEGHKNRTHNSISIFVRKMSSPSVLFSTTEINLGLLY